jgi:predicted O-methyltransferase YrrM
MRIKELKDRYTNEVFGLPDADLRRVRERMAVTGKEHISISGAEARILQFLIRGFGLKKAVEIGTFYGYSALAMAKALPADGVVVTLEKEPEHHAAAAETFKASPEGKKVVSLLGDAMELLKDAASRGPFDLAFIDANKSGYLDYLMWAEENVRKGGLIVGDNTYLWGALWNDPQRENIGEEQVRAMREFNKRLADPIRFNSILIPTEEGMTVAQVL